MFKGNVLEHQSGASIITDDDDDDDDYLIISNNIKVIELL